MKKILTFCFPVFLLVAACTNDIPDKEIVPKKKSESTFLSNEVVQASINEQAVDILQVGHVVKGSSVYVECKVNGYSFRENKEGKSVKLVLAIDGKNKKEYHTAAFVIPDFPAGKHELTLSLVSEEDQSMLSKKTFDVLIKE
ncbi:hypothetical protein [Bacillus sp. B1-b2]|uniref:hypothetical protein n=1 Tax=Bacillus sp. B1-b2 TaxID=2653201 RepID=UPI0012623F93|nr:hypothetical protein [Bacillus sp. B1-b2]KAB7669288.1 hypothetical protein F9279_10690 [Bacillus sp. B1-b2]